MITTTIVTTYGIIALSHLLIQLSFAHFSNISKGEISKGEHSKRFFPKAAIVVPCFNEEPELFERCIKSALDINYRGVYHVFAVDDGSKDKSAFELVSKIKSDKLTLISMEKNVGKRKAQKAAFDIIDNKYEIIVTLDSDTVLAPDSVEYLVRNFEDKNIGAVTGYASVINRERNLLTRLISSRYWIAFNLERAAQSLFGSVLCCTGVISAYRNNIIQDIKKEYVNQTFMGKECTYGDDRNLTNLILDNGYKTIYEQNAVGWTDVPKTMRKYMKQQLRWNRSFYRELFITIKMILKKPTKFPAYMIYDLIIQTIMPLALIVSVAYMIYRSFFLSSIYFVSFLGTLIGIGALRSIYAISVTRDYNFMYFPLYAFVHIFLLIPLRIYALFTLSGKGWGTR